MCVFVIHKQILFKHLNANTIYAYINRIRIYHRAIHIYTLTYSHIIMLYKCIDCAPEMLVNPYLVTMDIKDLSTVAQASRTTDVRYDYSVYYVIVYIHIMPMF